MYRDHVLPDISELYNRKFLLLRILVELMYFLFSNRSWFLFTRWRTKDLCNTAWCGTMSHTSFRMNPHCIVCLNVRELLVLSRRHIWSLSDRNEIRTHNHLVCERTFPKTSQWRQSFVSFLKLFLMPYFFCFIFLIDGWCV